MRIFCGSPAVEHGWWLPLCSTEFRGGVESSVAGAVACTLRGGRCLCLRESGGDIHLGSSVLHSALLFHLTRAT